MHVVGLITEYNPFHNGHLFHLTSAKEITGAEYAIAVMSGNFLQRGEPALFNKWSRAAMACASGVDLVLELPFVYATRSAQYFARGAVEILENTGIVTHLCFGSESGQANKLMEIAQILVSEPEEYKTLIKEEMTKGVILPVAQTKALASFLAGNSGSEELVALMGNPNNILGIEYIRALLNLNSKIIPTTVKRLSAQYHDRQFAGSVASATSIREFMKAEGFVADEINKVVPDKVLPFIAEEIKKGRGPVFADYLTLPLLSRLRTMQEGELAEIFDVSEGLENRIIEAAKDSTAFYELVAAIKSKRYAWTRIQRILIHTLLSFAKKTAERIDKNGPQYLRVLAFSEKGQELMHLIKQKGQLPLITKATRAEELNDISRKMMEYDVKATDLYTALYPNPEAMKGRADYLNSPVKI